ncbi:hypothetical protein CSUB01_12050 [Colletotrichum sublineola]|uniref:WD-like domain-containing protein n=1 Tax=Colletotrichum sublineola TaxID=1173701 RepID=A0A066X7N9_COLSU|nr:hypothetical protein CSUB01_12050 [Colletotrichum sublineola]
MQSLSSPTSPQPWAVIDPLKGKADLLAATNASTPDLVYAVILGNGLLEGFVDPSVPVIDAKDLEGPELDTRQGCGANTIRCSQQNQARTGICGRLLDILGGPAFVNRPLPAANFRRVGGSKTQHLFNAAVKTMNHCKNSALVSGSSPDVKLGNTCVKQCFSNGPNGC